MKVPSEDQDDLVDLVEHLVDKDWLYKQLRQDPCRLVILDCRSSNEYGESHIRNAVNFSIPSIMLRRLAAGKIELTSTVKSRDLRQKIVSALKENLFVVYGDSYDSKTPNDAISVLTKRLIHDGCRVVCLEDGFLEFKCTYPEWCESLDDTIAAAAADPDLPLMGLRSLRISSSAKETSAPSGQDELVEILPHLFLGNAENSAHRETLDKHSIRYIMNVTPNLPNVFEGQGSFKYMKIPITDHWSENLLSYFPKAIEFIDEARTKETGILVHCVAGVSRSVTVTVAYLMAKLSLCLNDAFSLVRARKANIAPNFHFMEQLHRFEQELITKGSVGSSASQTYLSPLSGQSPDSGIEFDRWTPSQ